MIAAKAGQGRSATRPIRLGRGLDLVAAIVAGLVGLESLRAAEASSGLSALSDSTIATVIGLLAGWGLVAVGLETRRRGRQLWFGALLLVAGIAWFLPDWSNPAIDSSIGFSVGLGMGWLYPAVVGHALLIAGRRSDGDHPDRAIVFAGYAVFLAGIGLLPTIAFDPRAGGCAFCPANLLHFIDPAPWVDTATRVAMVIAAVWSALVGLILVRRFAAGSLMTRGRRLVLVGPGIGFLALVGVALARDATIAIAPTDATDHLLRDGEAVALIALAVGVASEWLRARQARSRAARLVAELAASLPIGALRDHLATTLGDPELQLLYPLEGGSYVDQTGRSADRDPLPNRAMTPVLRDGVVVALIEHDRDVLRGPGEVDEVVAAARLGLEHERLQAELRAQLDALRSARRRIVDAGDARRKHLERDLHDGAQQHLIALSIALRILDRDTATSALVDDAAEEVRRALDDLRDVAHGIYPPVLDDEGLAAAVEALAEAAHVPVRLSEMTDERCDSSIEIAAYQLVAAAIHSATGPVDVRIERTEATLKVSVALPSVPHDVVEDVADRVGAVAGAVALGRTAGATILSAEMPCAS